MADALGGGSFLGNIGGAISGAFDGLGDVFGFGSTPQNINIDAVGATNPATDMVFGQGKDGVMGMMDLDNKNLVPGSVTGGIGADGISYGDFGSAKGSNVSLGGNTIKNIGGTAGATSGSALGGLGLKDLTDAFGAYLKYDAYKTDKNMKENQLKNFNTANQNTRDRTKSVNKQLSGDANYQTSGKDYEQYKD